MDNQANTDPWANMGNLGIGNKSGEISEEGLAREAKWSSVMEDAPAFAGESYTPENNERDDNIADASAIINYGLNAAAKEHGVEQVIQTINNFVPEGQGDPIKQLYVELGVDNREEAVNVIDEAHAAKPREDFYRTENTNAPTTINKSKEGALNAIKEVKGLVAEVMTSPDYADLRAEAMKAGKGVFEYTVSKYNVRDLTVLFNALSERKKEVEASKNEKAAEEEKKSDEPTPEEVELMNQIENHLSSSNPSPETDAAASNGSLL